jgi:hypothetical protein
MVQKQTIANILFLLALCYIISPWFFEKKFFFNEILALCGFGLLVYKHMRTGKDPITIYIILLLCLGIVHMVTSVFRADGLYYYLRNSVIIYSVFAFFLGYYMFKYAGEFVRKIRNLLTLYISFLIVLPLSQFLFERFGMAMLFPAIVRRKFLRYGLLSIILLCLVYGFVYSSATILVLCCFYSALAVIPGYRVLKQLTIVTLLLFLIFFISVQPNLSLIDKYYSIHNNEGIIAVINSHPLLALDASTTWRLVFWKQAIVDQFPANIIGLGFGTPLFRFYPVYDIEKLSTLPYVMGAHNSFVYLFARLGILYVLLLLGIYRHVFKEYFYYKNYYYRNGTILLFWSFFAISIVAFFNPVLESPVYASAYWLILGLLAKAGSQKTKYN